MKIKKLTGILFVAVALSIIGCGVKNSINSRVTTIDNTEPAIVNEQNIDDMNSSGIESEEQDEIESSENDSNADDSGLESTQQSIPDDGSNAETADDVENDQTESKTSTVPEPDLDLTKMSGIIVYSEVYNMLCYPEDYMDKTIRMAGVNGIVYDEEMNCYLFGCVISDATACCSQGIEYRLSDEFVNPDDYPEQGEDICVQGIFDTYDIGDFRYCYLKEAVIIEE